MRALIFGIIEFLIVTFGGVTMLLTANYRDPFQLGTVVLVMMLWLRSWKFRRDMLMCVELFKRMGKPAK